MHRLVNALVEHVSEVSILSKILSYRFGEKKKKHSYTHLADFCGSNFARSSIRSLVKSYFTNACYIQHPI